MRIFGAVEVAISVKSLGKFTGRVESVFCTLLHIFLSLHILKNPFPIYNIPKLLVLSQLKPEVLSIIVHVLQTPFVVYELDGEVELLRVDVEYLRIGGHVLHLLRLLDHAVVVDNPQHLEGEVPQD